MIPTLWSRIRSSALPLLLISLSSVTIISQATWQRVGHDLSSFLAPVVSITNGHSGFYETYFNVVPPGTHLILLPWVWLFGPGIWSMYVLHSLFVLGHQGALYFALRKWLDLIEASLVFVPVTVVTITQHVFKDMLLTTELVGNTFILTGFCILPLQTTGHHVRRWALGISLLTFAVVIREVYIFAPILGILAFSWHYRGERNRRLVALKLVAWVTVLGVAPAAALLIALEGLGPYFQVLHLKRLLFPWPDFWTIARSPLNISQTLVSLWPGLLIPVAGIAAAIGSIRRRQHPYILFFCLIGVGLVGAAFTWQGKPASGHYLAALLPPLAGLLAVSISQLRLMLYGWFKLLVLLLLLVPTPALLETRSELTSLQSPLSWWALTLGDLDLGNESKSNHKLSGCSQVVYGWNPGAHYITSESNPCSKYFLVNLIKNSAGHRAEYLLQLLASPPTVVIYSRSGADMNVDLFEQDVLPWSAVLATCYANTGGGVFAQRLDQGATRRCMLPFVEGPLFSNLAIARLTVGEVLSGGVQ